VSQKVDFRKHLNQKQLEAVSRSDGPVLVVAGAGSGKTRTIVYRVAWLVQQGVDPSSILLMTFTRKAAQEMLSRASQLIEMELFDVAGGTFHSTANLALRRYAHYLGIQSSYSIMDQSDIVDAIEFIRKNIVPGGNQGKGFPRSRTIAEILSRAAGTDTGIEQVLKERHPHFLEFIPQIEQIREMFMEHKRTNHLMDYDDLLLNFKALLENSEIARSELSLRWKYILVDEYQDTNTLQAEIVRKLAYEHDNVMAVGDDSQSIYSFRGADFRNIMEFPTLFPGTQVIRLEQNYRSTAPILHLTNSIIARATTGYPKRLFTEKKTGHLPVAFRPWGEREQSQIVTRLVQDSLRQGIGLSEMAVLFRAGFHSFDLEAELARNGIPFTKYGGFKFMESQHIKDVLAHLRVINNHRDRLSWMRILAILPGVGLKTASKLAHALSETLDLTQCKSLVTNSKKFKTHFDHLLNTIWNTKIMAGTIAKKVEEINSYYYPFLQERYDNYPKRMRDLDQLANLTVPYKSLTRFLNEMALEPPDDSASSDRRSQDDKLVLSTIHSAKGLEWHTVCLIWVTEGRIPSPQAEAMDEDLEEERRLLYVATTRARERLIIIAPRISFDRRYGSVEIPLSRFIEDVPHGCIQWCST
jgi:DNA helicase-2/ATP-dependent DNA helicase PcrA